MIIKDLGAALKLVLNETFLARQDSMTFRDLK